MGLLARSVSIFAALGSPPDGDSAWANCAMPGLGVYLTDGRGVDQARLEWPSPDRHRMRLIDAEVGIHIDIEADR